MVVVTELTIAVTFHGPVRVARGQAEAGLDDVVDRSRIPASSLKGVMRAAARYRLALPAAVVEHVFGTRRQAGAWSWDDLRLDGEGIVAAVTSRIRIPVDALSGAAARRGLHHAEELWVRGRPTFHVECTAPGGEVTPDEKLLLAAAAMAVHSLGSSRRRGLGWVSLQPHLEGRPVDAAAAAAAVVAARGADPA